MWGFVIALVVVLTLVAVAYFAFRNFVCKIPVIGGLLCGGGGVPQGGACTLDTDCAGWSITGSVACCGSVCVTKDQPIQTCPDYCGAHPDECTVGVPQGKVCRADFDCSGWSIGESVACCGATCVTKNSPTQTCKDYCAGNSASCRNGLGCMVDWDCPGWSVFGSVACCGGRCVSKDQAVQTCPDYCNKHPDVC